MNVSPTAMSTEGSARDRRPGRRRVPVPAGLGIHSDQLLGQFLVHVTGLGHILPPERVRTTLAAIRHHNFVRHVADVDTVQRV